MEKNPYKTPSLNAIGTAIWKKAGICMTAMLLLVLVPYEGRSQYCTSGATDPAEEDIGNVTFGSLNNGSATPMTGNSTAVNTYTNFTSLPAPNIQKDVATPISVSIINSGISTYTTVVNVFIDYNQNGAFDLPGERVFEATTPGSAASRTVTGSITIPLNAMLGNTRMRVIANEVNSGPLDPCGTYTWGETEDYTINITAPPACTAPPTAGTIGGNLNVCSSQSTALTITGRTVGSTVQWQSSPDGTTWTDVPGATNNTISTGPLSASTFFRANVTCGTSTVSTASVQVAVVTGAITTFPHTQNFDGVTQPAIPCGWTILDSNNDNFTWFTSNFASSSAPNSLIYSYNSVSPTVAANDWAISPAMTMDATKQYRVTFTYRVDAATWPEGLEVKFGNAPTAAGMTTTIFSNTNLTNNTFLTATGTIFTPATSGTYYLGFHAISAPDRSALFIDDITIMELSQCTGTPVAGTLPAATMGVCSGTVSTITATGATIATGVTYQWEQATSASGPWTNAVGGSGATTTTYTLPTLTSTRFYRLQVTCTASTQSATSAAIEVTINPPIACYCSTNLHSAACSATDNINTVTIAGTTLNNANTGCSSTNGQGYTAYPATGSTTATLQRTVTYNLSVTSTANSIMSVWIDYNQNGTFEASEWQQISTTSTAGTAVIVPVTIPANAVLGQTGMRIRSRFSGNNNGATDACTSMGSGETEDYIITIGPAPACTPPVKPTITVAAGSSTTICQGSSVVLTGASTTAGVTYRWSRNGAPIAGATSASYTANTVGNYRVIAMSGACSDSSNVTAVTINPKPATPTITKTGNMLTSSATTGTYQWFSVAGTTLTPVAGAITQNFTPAVNGDYTVRVTVNGCQSDAPTAMNVVLGISSLAPGMDVSVYPNPSEGRFTVNLVGFEKEASIQIINVTGQVIAAEKVTVTSDKASKAFNLSGMAKGIYILKVTSGDNLTFRKVILD